MKKQLLILSIGLFAIQAQAQITLTMQNSTPQAGDNIKYNVITNSNIDLLETQTGANQTWDYSSVSGTSQQIETINFVNQSTLEHSSHFPDATLGAQATSSIGSSSDTYFIINNDEMKINGLTTPSTGSSSFMNIEEGNHLLKFPLTYGTTYTDSLKSSSYQFISGQTSDPTPRLGVSTITGDGYGDLILPYGTVENVLRVKITRTYSDYFFGIPSFNYEETTYSYYTDYSPFYIASRTSLVANGNTALNSFTYKDQTSFPNLNTTELTSKAEPFIYPNPANSELNLINLSNNTSIKILDSQGKIVKQINSEDNHKISVNISPLNPGLYFAKLNSTTNQKVLKFIKQ